MQPDEVINNGQTEIAVGDEGGKVFIRFPKPIEWAAFDPDQAILIGEALILAGARCGVKVEIPMQERPPVSEQTRNKLVARALLMIKNLRERQIKEHTIASQVVDTVLAEIDK